MTTLVWYLTQRSSLETAAEAIKAARTKRFYRDPPEKNVVPLRVVESGARFMPKTTESNGL
jgi:hypothetical protein